MRHLDKGDAPTEEPEGTVIEFADYRDAAPYLKQKIGRYCCFCERMVPVSLAVEHKLPKRWHPLLERAWSNLLLACANCNSAKGDTDTASIPLVWPDEDNTLVVIEYARSGAVRPGEGLLPLQVERVLNLLRLVGLNRTPRESSSSDHRFYDRLEVWRTAEQSAMDLSECSPDKTAEMRRRIVDTARYAGGFSIWMKVFEHDLQMQSDLCTAFPGTAVARRY